MQTNSDEVNYLYVYGNITLSSISLRQFLVIQPKLALNLKCSDQLQNAWYLVFLIVLHARSKEFLLQSLYLQCLRYVGIDSLLNVCMYRLENNFGCHPHEHDQPLLRLGLSWLSNSPIRLYWLVMLKCVSAHMHACMHTHTRTNKFFKNILKIGGGEAHTTQHLKKSQHLKSCSGKYEKTDGVEEVRPLISL